VRRGVVYVDYLESDGQRGFQHACQMGLESIVRATCAKWQLTMTVKMNWQTEACQYGIEFGFAYGTCTVF